MFFGLATPPANHPNWPAAIYNELAGFQEGILLHYPIVGSNNPNFLPAPYISYNAAVRTGKMLVHETGHYMGLRHIWGDGNCSMDDFIKDTPRGNKASAYNCNHVANTCVDTINGADLPNMVENYMDYSSGNCQNSFTLGQINVMRTVIQNYRPNLLHTEKFEYTRNSNISYYPNPTSGDITIEFSSPVDNASINVLTIDGRLINSYTLSQTSKTKVEIGSQKGLYIIEAICDNRVSTFKVLSSKAGKMLLSEAQVVCPALFFFFGGLYLRLFSLIGTLI